MDRIAAESAVRRGGSAATFKAFASEVPPELLAAVRSRVPYRLCRECGESIGAARLTLHPEASICAWCASMDQPSRLAM